MAKFWPGAGSLESGLCIFSSWSLVQLNVILIVLYVCKVLLDSYLLPISTGSALNSYAFYGPPGTYQVSDEFLRFSTDLCNFHFYYAGPHTPSHPSVSALLFQLHKPIFIIVISAIF